MLILPSAIWAKSVVREFVGECQKTMKICWNRILKTMPLAALLLTGSLNAYAQSQSFSWTVTGTGTERYANDLYYHTVSVSCADGITYWKPAMGGQATHSYHLSADDLDPTSYAECGLAGPGGSSWTVVSGQNSKGGSGSLTVQEGYNYDVWTYEQDNGSAGMTVNFPDHYQEDPHTATRTASDPGNNSVSASDGQKNCYGFYCPPQPQNGGTMSGISYSLTWNNPNVVLFFSDTETTTTANPNADIIALWLPVPTVTTITPGLTNAIVTCTNVLPGGTATCEVFQNGVLMSSGTGGWGPNSTSNASSPVTFGIGNGAVPGVSCFQPGTTYQIVAYGQYDGFQSGYVTNSFTTLPVPIPAIVSVTPGLTNAIVTCTNVLPGGTVTSEVFQNGVLMSSSGTGGWGPNSTTDASSPVTFGIGNGAVPGVSCFQPGTTYQIVTYGQYGGSQSVNVTNTFTTLSVPVPTVTTITPGLTNAIVTCTNVLPGGTATSEVFQNGVLMSSSGTGGWGPNSTTNANSPVTFGIGNGAVPGVSCFQPGTAYQIVTYGQYGSFQSGYVTNSFTTLPVPIPTVVSIAAGLTNAIVTCTNVLPGGTATSEVFQNGVLMSSSGTGGWGPNSTTKASSPVTFGIGNGAVPGVSCFQPGTTYQIVTYGQYGSFQSGYVTNSFTTLPVPIPTVVSIAAGLTNAIVTCTNVLPGGTATSEVFQNGVLMSSSGTGGWGPNSTTHASSPVTFGIGNGAVPGVSCFQPGTTYQIVTYGQYGGSQSVNVTNSFTTLEPAGYGVLSSQLLSGGKIRLSFMGAGDVNYALERSYSLAPANWIPVLTNPADSLGMLILTNTFNGASNGFWRIRAVQ